MMRMVMFSVMASLLAAVTPAHAQMIWAEVGQQQNSFGNGATDTDLGWGFGLQATIGGDSGKDFGFAVPVGFELRADKDLDGADFLGVGDLAFRIGPVSFGPGANFGYIMRPQVQDSRCLAARLPVGSSCYAGDLAGYRDVGGFYGFGFSGFAKTAFGPQGRGFLQGRYIYYHKDWLYFRSTAEALNTTLGTDLELPTDYPDFAGGRDIRISAGYVLGGASSVTKILRVQLTQRNFDFSPDRANVSRVFDQNTRQLTFGVGFGF